MVWSGLPGLFAYILTVLTYSDGGVSRPRPISHTWYTPHGNVAPESQVPVTSQL